MNNLIVKSKSVFGQIRIYPINDTATKLARLAGSKTFTPEALLIIRQLGFTITEEPIYHD